MTHWLYIGCVQLTKHIYIVKHIRHIFFCLAPFPLSESASFANIPTYSIVSSSIIFAIVISFQFFFIFLRKRFDFFVSPLIKCYGSSLERSLGKRQVSRTLSSPISFIVRRSRPMPSPPCGGIPCLKISRY